VEDDPLRGTLQSLVAPADDQTTADAFDSHNHCEGDDVLAPLGSVDGTSVGAPGRQSGSRTSSSRRESYLPADVKGQHRFRGAEGELGFFNLRVIFEPNRTGFEEHKEFQAEPGTVVAGRYRVEDYLGQAAFSTAIQCLDMRSDPDNPEWVCLKVIKNNKDFFDQSLDEIKLLQYINSRGDPDKNHVLRMYDFFYYKEHLFIVSELLRENLYDFQRYMRGSSEEPYFTMPRLKRIMKQTLEALDYIHSLDLVHCDVKPENIVIKSYSRCEVKLIDFGSSCYTHDHLTSYIQSRSYRAPEVILGMPYDQRIDVWSLGAVLAELHTAYVLFQNDSIQTMLARITGIIGAFPEHMLESGRESPRYFTAGRVIFDKSEEDGEYHLIYPKRTTLRARLHSDDDDFVDFVRYLLTLDPLTRPTAGEALRHPFIASADEAAAAYVVRS